MPNPKKINSENLRSSVVEIRYTSSLPFDILLGYLYKSLDSSYFYTNIPIPKSHLPFDINKARELPKDNSSIKIPQSLFYTDKLLINLLPNRIIFDKQTDYLGWDIYFTEISKTLKQLSSVSEILSYNRIGIRYTNEYSNKALSEFVKFDFSFGMSDIKSDSYSFSSTFKDDRFKVILNFSNIIQKEIDLVSKIDIDTSLENISIADVDSLIKAIDDTHSKEKDVFFKVLKEDFIKTLNPVY